MPITNIHGQEICMFLYNINTKKTIMKKILYLACLLLIVTACAQIEKTDIFVADLSTVDREKSKKYADVVSFDIKNLSEIEVFALLEASYRHVQRKHHPQPRSGRPNPTKIYTELNLYDIKSVPCLHLDEETFLANPTPNNLLKNLKPAQTGMVFSLSHKDSIGEYQLWRVEKSVRTGVWVAKARYPMWREVQERLPKEVIQTGYSVFTFYAKIYMLVFDETGQAVIYNPMGEKEDLESLCDYIASTLKSRNPDGTFSTIG
jgi:uncharacterized lipoprotein YajG